jgi:hypothetical protein
MDAVGWRDATGVEGISNFSAGRGAALSSALGATSLRRGSFHSQPIPVDIFKLSRNSLTIMVTNVDSPKMFDGDLHLYFLLGGIAVAAIEMLSSF